MEKFLELFIITSFIQNACSEGQISPDTLLKLECHKLLPLVLNYCHSEKPAPAARFCKLYSLFCTRHNERTSSVNLRDVASSFDSDVDIVTGAWGVNGIPFYPFNRRRTISGGKRGTVGFGTWGGGYSEDQGVSDFWNHGSRAGGNWYTGRYGGGHRWEVPFFPGVEGGSGTDVRVPISPGNFGKPVSVGQRNHVGQFWGGGNNAQVDWFQGSVGSGKGWSVPFVGINGGLGEKITFPSLAKFIRNTN